jgi:hypothetical protein
VTIATFLNNISVIDIVPVNSGCTEMTNHIHFVYAIRYIRSNMNDSVTMHVFIIYEATNYRDNM